MSNPISHDGHRLIRLRDAFERYISELPTQKRISNTYEWYLRNLRSRSTVKFSDVSIHKQDIELIPIKLNGVWYVDEDTFENGLVILKQNVKNHIPQIHKWWK